MTFGSVWLSSWSNVILQLTNQHHWSTLFHDYCDHLPLTSSCIPFTAQLYSSSQRFRPQAIWHQKLQTLWFTSFHFYPKLLDMPAFSISFTEQPVGSQPHCPSMKCNCASTTVETWVSGNRLDDAYISLFQEFTLCRRPWLIKHPWLAKYTLRIKCIFWVNFWFAL